MSLLKLIAFVANHPANAGHRLQALLRLLRWQIASRLVSCDMVHEWIGGSRFLARSGEHGLTGNIYVGLQEFHDMAFVLHMLRPGDFFVDVGANVGSYSILACAVAGARGCAIEPVPATFARLLENMRINHLEDSVQCMNVGLGSALGTLRFSSDMGVCNRALGASENRAGDIMVQATTLDLLLAGRRPCLIKIDVEGYEAAVLAGARETLSDHELKAVIIEVNGSGERYGFTESQLFDTMAGYGFHACTYDAAERRLNTPDSMAKRASDNTIFVRDPEQVGERLRNAQGFSVNGNRF